MACSESPVTNCVFCAIVRGDRAPGTIAYRDHATVVFPSLHQRPRNPGHMLVIPTAHMPYIYDVDSSTGGALFATVAAVARAVKTVWLVADGVVVRQNNERHGDQDVFHIPRFAGDGFNRGEDRHPFGVVEVPEFERVGQANKVRKVLLSDVAFGESRSPVQQAYTADGSWKVVLLMPTAAADTQNR